MQLLTFDGQTHWLPGSHLTREPEHQHPGHIHVRTTTLPTEPVNGPVRFDLVVETFHLPGVVNKVQFSGDGLKGVQRNPNRRVEHDESNWIESFEFDTSALPDGEKGIKAEARILADEDGTTVSMAWKAAFETRNGNAFDARRKGKWEVQSWNVLKGAAGNLDSNGYVSIEIAADYIRQLQSVNLDELPVMFGRSLRQRDGIFGNGFASLDPRLHAGIMGTVLFDQKLTSPNVVIPLREQLALLAPGPHKLFLSVDDAGAFDHGVLKAVMVIGFNR
jgi:hypothetical protein